jgi:Na+-translocating ferredoxin:NAD+ oxidoreductase RnfC subunit
MALYNNSKFRGIKVGSTTKSAKRRKNQILKSERTLEFGFNRIEILSIEEYETPHMMYASEALLHQVADEIFKLEQAKSDYFFMRYGYITKSNNYYSEIASTMITKHHEISIFLNSFPG